MCICCEAQENGQIFNRKYYSFFVSFELMSFISTRSLMELRQEVVIDKQDGVKYVRSAHKTRVGADQHVQETLVVRW